jgi:hypothetical protein
MKFLSLSLAPACAAVASSRAERAKSDLCNILIMLNNLKLQ